MTATQKDFSAIPAARDTTFDNVKPEKFWAGVTNMKGDKELKFIVEIDGIEKVIWSGNPAHATCDNGMINDYTNLTWLLIQHRQWVLANDPAVLSLLEYVRVNVFAGDQTAAMALSAYQAAVKEGEK